MEKEYRYLLQLLGAYVNRRAPEPAADVDWEKLLQLAKTHTVTGILGHMAKKYQLCPDPQTAGTLRQAALATAMKFARRAELCGAFCRQLNKAGIEHILMKGAVVRDYYPVPELRTFGDVDLVIHPEDREKCHVLMLASGFTPKVDWGPVYSYIRGDEFYEIHTDIMEVDVSAKADYRGYFARMWDYTVPREDGSLEFTPEFHFLYQLTHIAKHVSRAGAGARMYLDLAACTLHFGDRLDWAWLRRELERLELLDFGSVALTAMERWFGVSCPMEKKEIPEDVMERFLAFTMEAGLYGKDNRDTGLNTLKRSGQEGGGSRLSLLLARVFPSAEQIQSRYTYLQEKPWLLPVAWVHRVFKNREKLSDRAREAKTILSADTEEVTRLQKLTEDIGL